MEADGEGAEGVSDGHDALRRLGVFSPGDKVIYTPDDPFSFEEYAVVLRLADDGGPREKNGHVKVRLEGSVDRRSASDGARPRTVWVFRSRLRHRDDLMRERALRRLQDPDVHLQTVMQAWAHDAGVVERNGDPLCGATGGRMVRAEARVTCPACRKLMEELPRP